MSAAIWASFVLTLGALAASDRFKISAEPAVPLTLSELTALRDELSKARADLQTATTALSKQENRPETKGTSP
jgi:hypothetical protein